MEIQIKNAIKSYGQSFELKIKDLNLTEGIYAVLGFNGSGKSTFFNGLTDVNPMDSMEISEGEAYLKNHSIMLQQVYMFRGTVMENVLLPLKLHQKNLSFSTGWLEDWLIRLDLDKYKNHSARQLSGGEKAKVAFLRSLVTNPDVLILDEATSNIDVRSKQIIGQGIKDIYEEKNRIILFSTHNYFEVAKVATHLLIFDQGQVIAVGQKDSVLESENPLIKELMNIF